MMWIKAPTAFMTSGALIASSGGEPPEVGEHAELLEDVQDVAEDKPSAIALDPSATPSIEVAQGELSGDLPDGDAWTMELPGDAVDSTESLDGLSVETSGDGYSSVVEDFDDGTFRTFLHIDSEEATENFDFVFSDDVSLEAIDDGSVSVTDENGTEVGVLEAPWAVDANGEPVETEYAVQGSRVTQNVSHASVSAYPVVADPFWIPALGVVARLSGHAAMRAGQRGVSNQMMQQTVQNGVRTAGNGNTSIFTQGSGANKIRVIVNNNTGNIVTVTRG